MSIIFKWNANNGNRREKSSLHIKVGMPEFVGGFMVRRGSVGPGDDVEAWCTRCKMNLNHE